MHWIHTMAALSYGKTPLWLLVQSIKVSLSYTHILSRNYYFQMKLWKEINYEKSRETIACIKKKKKEKLFTRPLVRL